MIPDRMRGLTIVELLVAGIVLVVILGVAGVFFAQQTQLQRNVQARNEVQDRVRVAVQLVSQDLALAGNSVIIRGDGSIDPAANLPASGCAVDLVGVSTNTCLALVSGGDRDSALGLRYLSSQFDTGDACRDVSYRLQGTVLQRSDVSCDDEPVWRDLAPATLAFKVVVICSDGSRIDGYPDGACGPPSSYGRSAIVSVVSETVAVVPGNDVPRSVVSTNAAPVVVPCRENRLCFGATEETLMPNLKDR